MRLRTAVVAAVLAGLAPFAAAHAATYVPSAEAGSLALLNAARSQNGLRPLPAQAALTSMARAQAARMAARGSIYHNPNLASDATAAGLNWQRLGENVGVGPTVDQINSAFLASPHHRENMLSPYYNAIGVGVVPGTGENEGRIFVAHVFAQLIAKAHSVTTAPRPVTHVAAVARPLVLETPKPRLVATPTASPLPNALDEGLVDRTVLLPALG